MDLMYKICGIADAHKGTPRIDIVLPTVDLLVVLEGEPIFFVLCFEIEAVGLDIGALDVGNIAKLDDGLRGR
jgi:hypothetical protein